MGILAPRVVKELRRVCWGSGKTASDLCAPGTAALPHVAGSSLLAVAARRPRGTDGVTRHSPQAPLTC